MVSKLIQSYESDLKLLGVSGLSRNALQNLKNLKQDPEHCAEECAKRLLATDVPAAVGCTGAIPPQELARKKLRAGPIAAQNVYTDEADVVDMQLYSKHIKVCFGQPLHCPPAPSVPLPLTLSHPILITLRKRIVETQGSILWVSFLFRMHSLLWPAHSITRLLLSMHSFPSSVLKSCRQLHQSIYQTSTSFRYFFGCFCSLLGHAYNF